MFGFERALNSQFDPVRPLYPHGLPRSLVTLHDSLLAVDRVLASESKCHLHRENCQFALLSVAEMAVADFFDNTSSTPSGIASDF
jgi:hypothetical protein